MKKPRTILKKPKPFDVTSFYRESDKGCAIMIGTLLEDALRRFHEVHINLVCPAGAKALARLFESFGLLATFEAKTVMGYAFGLITTDEHEELNLFRKIRNEAAHSLFEFSLDDEGIQSLIQRFTSFDKVSPRCGENISTKERIERDDLVDSEFSKLSEAKQVFLVNGRSLEMLLLDRVYDKEMELLAREKKDLAKEKEQLEIRRLLEKKMKEMYGE
jgi:hypothetical protein